ncbi:ATP-binding protein [Aliidiomarina halalkaliphila]|uniref:ATP-binding protein n=1 Tax=Aliidiomarina halalkaliphila TaxID=2593535 RepID=A0A552X0Y7_9GAMM|nr:ATP-binding protein [Aliidiomarina halalkaliphila]TRW48718.1 ATP-binding protein [Aliidiomarina halalkaliphila]
MGIYCARQLLIHDKTSDESHSESEIFNQQWDCLVVLGEPGAGKSSLLKNIANLHDGKMFEAAGVEYSVVQDYCPLLLIDGFDELPSSHPNELRKIIHFAMKSKPNRLVISSRASEWGMAHTHVMKAQYAKLITVTLKPLSEEDKRAIFNAVESVSGYLTFKDELLTAGVWELTDNPQLLLILAAAWAQGETYTTKTDAFKKATEQMAKELREDYTNTLKSSLFARIQNAHEIFAKLLLAAKTGVVVTSSSQLSGFTPVESVSTTELLQSEVLKTALFSPGPQPGSFRPAHRTIAEYGAASYLVSVITSSPNPHLKIRELLTVIAPNQVVRPDLRGLVAWLASLGDSDIRTQLVELLPYSILTDGDISLFSTCERITLLNRIEQLSKEDPYFRASDGWKQLQSFDFINVGLVDSVRKILLDPESRKTHLLDVVLELLVGTEASSELICELQSIALSNAYSDHFRTLAYRALSTSAASNLANFTIELMQQGSHIALRLSAKCIIEHPQLSTFEILCIFFHQSARSYGSNAKWTWQPSTSHYYVKEIANVIERSQAEFLIEYFLLELSTRDFKDEAQKADYYGLSKVIAILVDRCIDDDPSTTFPLETLFRWISPLRFNNTFKSSIVNSSSVNLLNSNDDYRRRFILYASSQCSSVDEISDIWSFSIHHRHSGICLIVGDKKFLVQAAFETRNFLLWEALYQKVYRHFNRPNPEYSQVRSLMREHAKEDPAFARVWYRLERSSRNISKYSYYYRKGYLKDENCVKQERKPLPLNTLASGKNRDALLLVAGKILNLPFGDHGYDFSLLTHQASFLSGALRRAASFPELDRTDRRALVALNDTSELLILRALVILAHKGAVSFDNIPLEALKYARLSFSANETYDDDQLTLDAIHAIESFLFIDIKDRTRFARQVIEPQLSKLSYQLQYVDVIRDIISDAKVFGALAIEWMTQVELPADWPEQQLFTAALDVSVYPQLITLIKKRADHYVILSSGQDFEPSKESRLWLTRGLQHLQEPEKYWSALVKDETAIFHLSELDDFGSNDTGDVSRPLPADLRIKMLCDLIDIWPYCKLPLSYGTGSPKNEQGYRRVRKLLHSLSDASESTTLIELQRLLKDSRFEEEKETIQSIIARVRLNVAHASYTPPSIARLNDFLSSKSIISVEQLKEIVIDELQALQKRLNGSELHSKKSFYDKEINSDDGKKTAHLRHCDEEDCSREVANKMQVSLQPRRIKIDLESRMSDEKRCDITVTYIDGNCNLMVPIEAKGQWHRELYTASSEQLERLYTKHPDAGGYGIYLVYWFGRNEKIAGKVASEISTADELRSSIEEKLTDEQRERITVFVLDLDMHQ